MGIFAHKLNLQSLLFLALLASAASAADSRGECDVFRRELDSLRLQIRQLETENAVLRSAKWTKHPDLERSNEFVASAANPISDTENDIAVQNNLAGKTQEDILQSKKNKKNKKNKKDSASALAPTAPTTPFLPPNNQFTLSQMMKENFTEMWQLVNEMNPGTGGACKDRCRQKCWVDNKEYDANCTMADSRLQKFVEQVKPIRAVTPQWQFKGNSIGNPIIKCPCDTKHGLMTQKQALRSIIGQVASIGVPHYVAKAALGFDKSKMNFPMNHNARIAIAVMRMFHCWKAKCSHDQATETPTESLLGGGANGMFDALDDDLDWGGGGAC
jgi:hypothetical protein